MLQHICVTWTTTKSSVPGRSSEFLRGGRGMSTVHETIYPVSPAEPGAAELKVAFTPSAAKIRLVRWRSRQKASAVLIMAQLKLPQRRHPHPSPEAAARLARHPGVRCERDSVAY